VSWLVAAAALVFQAQPAPPPAQPAPRRVEPAGIPVHYSESTVHGFLELHDAGGALLADGDQLQVHRGAAVESRLVLRFRDGSFSEETVLFTQHDVFEVRSYHLVQRGPAFSQDLDASFERPTGAWQVKTKSHSCEEKSWSGTMDLPPDTYNGLIITLLKNLVPGETQTVHVVAFTPQPRLIRLELAPTGEQRIVNGQHSERAVLYTLKPRLGALVGFFARLTGKMPPDSHAWILTDDVPAFVRFEGPMYMGPVWRLELGSPHFPR